MPGDMKEQIAKAAADLIFDKKVKKLNVTDIVRVCNITRQTFYYHFEDVPHLLEWILERELRQMQDEAREKSDVKERFRYFFGTCIHFKPYIDRTMESNYGAELSRMIQRQIRKLAEQTAE